MASTPSNRLRLTPSNSPLLNSPLHPRPRPFRPSYRGRAPPTIDSRLSLKRVIGTTCTTPVGFDAIDSAFAYIAGGAVVVASVDRDQCSQRFFRARPTAIPVYSTPALPYSSTPTSTPKANDSRNRVSLRDSTYAHDWSDSPSSKTWTSRERIKAATCLALSKEGRFLAVGETGYAPRVLIYGLEDRSSDNPLVSISEHAHGVRAVAWSRDSSYLASLGSINDGFLYVWKVDTKTGAARLFQQNRCTSYVRGMVWMGHNLITFGVRHIKVWRVDEVQPTSPTKLKLAGDSTVPVATQKTLSGRNVVLGNMMEATFSCAAAIDDSRTIICSETGDVCVLDDTGSQVKLSNILESGFVTTCVDIQDGVAYLGGKLSGFLRLELDLLKGNASSSRTDGESATGLFALGFMKDRMVTVDSQRSIHIWQRDDGSDEAYIKSSSIPIPGHRDPILGVETITRPNACDADFYSWSGSGYVTLWNVEGKIKSSFQVSLDEICFEDEPDLVNEMTTIRATKGGSFFVTGDKLGIVKIIEFPSTRCIASMRAHSSDCQFVNICEDNSRFLIASCGRDRTVQLFCRTTHGHFNHFQTLEFAARVVQAIVLSPDQIVTCSLDRTLQFHDLVNKGKDDPDAMAAIPSKCLPLKASPVSMAIGLDGKSLFVSVLDKSIHVFDLEEKKLSKTFKCIDESGVEMVVLDSLISRPDSEKEPAFLLGISNTDKSIRIYNAQSGQFLDRQWGHTEAINGVALIEEDGDRKVVSVGSDGTIMVWELDLGDRTCVSTSRDTSPAKDGSAVTRPTLRRVLSKAELAQFQRPSSSVGQRSPRTLRKRQSLFSISSTASSRPPINALPSSPSSAAAEDTPSRRPSNGSQPGSPPVSPRTRVIRRPSLPTLNSVKTKSSSNLRPFGSLNMATEQTCRTLRTYRKKLSTTESINENVLAELDQELRLTAAALGERASRGKAMSDTVLNTLLDQYSERLVSLLDEKLRLNYPSPSEKDPESPIRRPGTAGSGSGSSND